MLVSSIRLVQVRSTLNHSHVYFTLYLLQVLKQIYHLRAAMVVTLRQQQLVRLYSGAAGYCLVYCWQYLWLL